MIFQLTHNLSPNEDRKIRARGSHIPMTLVNICRLPKMISPTKKKSIAATKRRDTAAVPIGEVYPNLL
jgi:hypothetical protein